MAPPFGKSVGSKARAFWRWSNFLDACNTKSFLPVLRINMDETCCKLVPPVRKGIVMARGRKFKELVSRGRGSSLNARRSAVSYVAFVCDDERVQAKLPQIFVSNQHVLNKKDFAVLRGIGGGLVRVLRRVSACVNTSLLIEIIGFLARSIEEERHTHHVILSMDAYRAHLSLEVVRACSDAGIHLMYVPAAMTGWLQPLDVIVFRKFKAWVSREVEQQKLESVDGLLPNVEVVAAYIRGVAAVIAKQDWKRAFELTGLGSQANVSKRLKARLQWEEVPAISSTLPEFSELQVVYPRRYTIPIDEIFELPLVASRPPPLVLHTSARLPPARPVMKPPLGDVGKLRR